ncbi:MAG: 50S ribosomal protein L10 [Cytophagales bacterium]|nr:50S ribosomal protein L10 [Cytophagales bacterium]
MIREEKAQIIESLGEQFSASAYFYIIDAAGLTVEEVNDFRRKCFEKGVVYMVVKNTLIKKSLERLENDIDYSVLNEQVLKGFSGILISKDAANIPAKIMKAFRKERGKDKPTLKGASIDGELFIGHEHLEALSRLKSKTELIGEVINLLQSPAMKVITSLQDSKHKLAGILKTLSKKQS